MARSTRRYEGFKRPDRTEFLHRSLGKAFLNYEHEVVLQVGDDAWTRAELASELGCCHLAAARRLSKNLDEHGIDSITKLHLTTPAELMAMAGIGTIQIFVVMCVLDAKKFDAEKWYGFDDDTVTTTTLGLRAKHARAAELEVRRAAGPRLSKRAS